MQTLRAAKKADRNCFDSQIAAFQGCLATVHATANVATEKEPWEQTQRGQEPPV